MSSAQLAPGTVVETFTVASVVRSRIGATTYAAQGAAGEAVELTVYGNDCFPSALVLERSLREVRQLQTVTHPRLVRILGCGKLAGGGTWEAHLPLPPESLAQHLARGPLADADALAIASQIGDALSEAQKVGVIHRNLGADVVFPSPDGVVVAGFAVGAPLGGKSFGPIDAIAPEQVEGKVVDQRTLIYNLAALVWHMLRGAPLYTGDTASVLSSHVSADLPADLPTTLRRGLAKDPRVRPMMLRQFVTELGHGGATAPAAGAPTSRGWTMFTAAIPDTPGPVAAPTPATATPAAAAPAPAAPASAPAAAGDAKPTTRGWTMFMQAVDDGAPASGSTPTPAPASTPTPAAAPATVAAAPAAAAPAAAAPATPAAPAVDAAKPTTRGWTMFMQAADEAPASTPTPGSATPIATPVTSQPAAPAPAAAAPTPAAAPAPAAGATPPSSRGWTMFTSADPAPAPATPISASTATPVTTPAPATAAAPVAAAPAAAASAPAAPAAPADPNKPTTRGWTMFTRDDEAQPADPAPTPAATPEEAPRDGEAEPPSSRGWTMFMEPGAAAAMQQQAGIAPEAAPAPASEPAPAATEAEAPTGQRRGWTMFMEAPIGAASPSSLGPNAATDAAPAAEAPPADGASSDNRGWTVFGAPAPGAAAAPTAPAPEASRTVVVTSPAVAPVAHDASEGPTASGQVTATEAPDPAPGRGRTVVAMGVPAEPGTVGGVTGRTVFPASQQPQPDTQYFRRGDIPADRPAQRTTAADVPVPTNRGPAEERDARALPVQRGNDLPANTGSRSGMLIVVGVVAVAAIVAVVWAVT